jgi:hypothetical protein
LEFFKIQWPVEGQVNVTTKPDTKVVEAYISAAALYRKCLADEESWTKNDYGKLKVQFFKGYLRNQPFFPPDSSPQDAVCNSSEDYKRYLQIRSQLNDGIRYRELLRRLKGTRDRHARLFLIAWWLTEEDVADPEDVIGFEEIQKRANRMFRALSPSDFKNADRVRAWLPYFERLLRDGYQKSDRDLRKQGYEETAVKVASKKRSPVAAACEWLAKSRPSLNITGPTLANAYSRLYGPKRLLFVNQQNTVHFTKIPSANL